MFELGSLVSGAWSGPPRRFANFYIHSFVELVIVTCTVHRPASGCRRTTREPRCLCRGVTLAPASCGAGSDVATYGRTTPCSVTRRSVGLRCTRLVLGFPYYVDRVCSKLSAGIYLPRVLSKFTALLGHW